MDGYAESRDGTRIHYETSGQGEPALLFAHGWLGNARWWDAQREHFAGRHLIVQMDLAGQGKSATTRTDWSARSHVEDLAAVARQIDARRIILVGHSMSGAFAVAAFPLIPRTAAIILVDTVKDLVAPMSPEQVEQIFTLYRTDFRGTVQNVLPRYLFADSSPQAVRDRILGELLAADPGPAIAALEPLYALDLKDAARRVTVPVRAINSAYTPTNLDGNRAYFRDYDFVSITGTGHYPMLEDPEAFNHALERTLAGL